ncbi:unnamed protein product [Pylaiella littoralis]
MLPWTELHRPTSLVDVCGNEDVIKAMRSFKSVAAVPHLILHGPPGSGKTSSVLAMARQFFGMSEMSTNVLELNAGDVRGIDTMRNQIQCFTNCSSFAENATATSVPITKLVVLDEADSLTHHAQCALRHLIEQSGSRARYCLCCNYIDRLCSGIRSRCTSFRFSGVGKLRLRLTLQGIVKREGLEVSRQSLVDIVDICSGDARQAINLLQSLCLSGAACGVQQVYQSCGLPSPTEISTIFDALLTQSFSAAHQSLSYLVTIRQLSASQNIPPLVEKIVGCSGGTIGTEKMGQIISILADVEHCVSEGGGESIALGAIVSAFHLK